jgi:hypothetical protein
VGIASAGIASMVIAAAGFASMNIAGACLRGHRLHEFCMSQVVVRLRNGVNKCGLGASMRVTVHAEVVDQLLSLIES